MLVHGAWHGGWCWRRVAEILRRAGHSVYTPTLTGLGERSHLLHSAIDLATHIKDIVNVFQWEDIQSAVLCGHSYGGWVISGVVEEVAQRVRSMMFIDAHVPTDGARCVDVLRDRTEIERAMRNGRISIPPKAGEYFGVNETDRGWLESKLTPHPIRVFFDPIHLTGARDRVAEKHYIRASKSPSVSLDKAYAQAAAEGWHTLRLCGGHDLMIDNPDGVARVLVAAGEVK